MLFCENHKLQFESIGLFSTQREWIHPARIIDSDEIILMMKGEAFIEEDEVCYHLVPGDVLLLEAGKKHCGYQVSGTETSFYWLHFKTDIPVSFKCFHPVEGYELRTLFKSLLHKSRSPGYTGMEWDALTLLILRELQLAVQQSTEAGDSLMHQLVEYIRINIGYELTVKKLSEQFGYNETYLGRRFRKFSGFGLKEYLCREKMRHAKDLLQNTDFSVKEIAGMCGYREENLFLKFFCYHEGISPSGFRNLYCHTHMNNR